MVMTVSQTTKVDSQGRSMKKCLNYMCENMTNEITYDISINVIQLVVSFNNELITSFELHVFYANLD